MSRAPWPGHGAPAGPPGGVLGAQWMTAPEGGTPARRAEWLAPKHRASRAPASRRATRRSRFSQAPGRLHRQHRQVTTNVQPAVQPCGRPRWEQRRVVAACASPGSSGCHCRAWTTRPCLKTPLPLMPRLQRRTGPCAGLCALPGNWLLRSCGSASSFAPVGHTKTLTAGFGPFVRAEGLYWPVCAGRLSPRRLVLVCRHPGSAWRPWLPQRRPRAVAPPRQRDRGRCSRSRQ